jgi:hypothetical protein
MLLRKKILITLTFLALALTIFVPQTSAKGNEYDAVCNHLKSKYQAKKVKIPFMWLARFAVGIVRPAGVKSFKVTIFRNLKFSPETLNEEMKLTMRDSFSDEWTPILRVRSANGEQVFMNMREAGKNVKILLVTINKDEAVVVRAKFNPDKLAKFIENPKIFGISLDGREESSDKNISIERDQNSDKIIYEDDSDDQDGDGDENTDNGDGNVDPEAKLN